MAFLHNSRNHPETNDQRIAERENELLHGLVESLPDAVLVVSSGGELPYFNRQFAEIWNLPETVLNSRSEEAALHWAVEQVADPEAFLTRINETYADPVGPSMQDEIQMKDGRIFDRFHSPIRFGGVHYGSAWTFHDVTARREAEQARRLKDMAAQLISGEKSERERIGALLHDDLQQLLVAARMKLQTSIPRTNEIPARHSIEHAIEWIDEAIAAARNLAHDLRPPELHEQGLLAGLNWLAAQMAKRYDLEVVIHHETSFRELKIETRSLLFECIRELLFNVTKYAGIKVATISIIEEGEWMRVTVKDEGDGFDVASSKKDGSGIFHVRQQLMRAGGDIAIESEPGHGTRVELVLPVKMALKEQDSQDPLHSGPDWDGNHMVQFYQRDQELIDSLADFAGEGLLKLEKVIVILTPEHRIALDRQLRQRGLELVRLRVQGLYVALDAADTLAKFMRNGMPDEGRLFELIEPVIADPDADGRPIRIFGEMVALVQAVGNSGGAVRLEELWNKLSRRHAFSLLCAYPIQSFSGADHEESLLCVCHAHDNVIPPKSGPAELNTREWGIVADFLRRKAIAP